ncbi:MAG: vitamin B12-dependent ribonucleotide reductase, partial [Thermoanaerobaculia bacterium]|nr:vitamin B12-dependent ribonucleotide reductase [Thermoanaerobaculia bacterium]
MDPVRPETEAPTRPEGASPETPPQRRGLTFERRYTRPGVHPYDEVEWELREARISGEEGETVFVQTDVEAPASWSQQATNVVASKYFRGALGSEGRESSVRRLIDRVVDTIAGWGRAGGYFATPEDATVFEEELRHLLLHQMVCFNSPVWFNVGVAEKPQCSACFINSVEDTMQSILDLAKTEGMLFKYGSGTGTNLSVLRASGEPLAGGGTASGPVSFMRGYDAFAGVIKSGGTTRRAAKMVILDVDHPDVEEFIVCKAEEERKARALIEAGWDAGFDSAGGAYDSVFFQNANHSVRARDEFLRAVEEDGEWVTRSVTDGSPARRYRARDLMRKIAESAWFCGDPGLQFDTTINDWHTCPATDRIRASNPCSEFMFLDDTACNLASLNLMRFRDPGGGRFDCEGFAHACEVTITAQEILVDNAGYPRPEIAENSRDFRPLGLGFANLGALLMSSGLPYDSEPGRQSAAAVTALMSGAAYAQSARIAAVRGPFAGFAANREPALRVMRKHREALSDLDPARVPLDLLTAARAAWTEVVELSEKHGLRNSQISVIAPTGTIGFMMDCDTTGIEPDIALVKYKKLVGGGSMKIVNRTVPAALERLGYGEAERAAIVEHVDREGTIEGAPGLAEEHLPVFDCAFPPAAGGRAIAPSGHLKMVAAVQPFVSGAISKTINMPRETTVEEIEAAYLEGWRLGLKAVAVYRDGCKQSQPLSTSPEGEGRAQPLRRRLPDERQALTHKFSVNGHEGYITVGLYEDGQPGEIFLVMAKEGSTISGLMDAFATSVSIALQYRVPLATLVRKFCHTRFEPSGFTQNPQIPIAKSVTDYIFRWMATKFLSREDQEALGIVFRDGKTRLTVLPAEAESVPRPAESNVLTFHNQQDAPLCQDCGAIMV